MLLAATDDVTDMWECGEEVVEFLMRYRRGLRVGDEEVLCVDAKRGSSDCLLSRRSLVHRYATVKTNDFTWDSEIVREGDSEQVT